MQTGPTVALIVAAGHGSRSGSSVPKQYRAIGGRAMIAHAHAMLSAHPAIDEVVVVIGEGQQAMLAKAIGDVRYVFGGATRRESVAAGLAAIGAAARVVHEGCAKVLKEHFTIQPVRGEAEGSRIELPEGFDAAAVRLTGNVVGKAPFKGTLSHRGWRSAEVRLPKLAEAHDASILAPAEVEL